MAILIQKTMENIAAHGGISSSGQKSTQVYLLRVSQWFILVEIVGILNV